MRLSEISYWTTIIDQRDPDKYKDDLYFRKALGLVSEWILGTATLKIKPKGIFQNAFNKLTNPPYEEDPMDEIFRRRHD